MQTAPAAGPRTAVEKYDLITALTTHALSACPSLQRSVLRFIQLLTARYNWRTGTLEIGQKEIARMWSVNERTVKREMARLREIGWLILENPGRRGQVSRYRLNVFCIRAETRHCWPLVGPDFEQRMGRPEHQNENDPAGVGQEGSTPPSEAVQYPVDEYLDQSRSANCGTWSRAQAALREENPAVFRNWFESLRVANADSSRLVLKAPNAFHARYISTHYDRVLHDALRSTGVDLQTVEITF